MNEGPLRASSSQWWPTKGLTICFVHRVRLCAPSGSHSDFSGFFLLLALFVKELLVAGAEIFVCNLAELAVGFLFVFDTQ